MLVYQRVSWVVWVATCILVILVKSATSWWWVTNQCENKCLIYLSLYLYIYIFIIIYLSILATQEWMCRLPWIGVWLGSKWQQPTRKDDQQIYQLHWPANSLRERLKKGHSWSSKGPEVDGSEWNWEMELGDSEAIKNAILTIEFS